MDNLELIRLGTERLKNGENLELAQIVTSSGSTPRGSDAFMLIGPEGCIGGTVGGGTVEFLAQKDAAEFLRKEEDGEKPYNLSRGETDSIGMICGGDVSISFTWLSGEEGISFLAEKEKKIRAGKPVCWIFGGGHVSVCTAAELVRIGFDVVVYDDRPEFASPDRFPFAKEVICASYDEIGKHVTVGEGDYVVVMTRGHVCDYEAQKFAIGTKACYIGVIGSHAKTAEVSRKLLSDGIPAEKIGACFAPIGIQIAAETPEEIAVSIAAEMILVRARRENRRKVREHKTIDYR